MVNTKYELRYLPLFYEDLEQKVMEIRRFLYNKQNQDKFI